MGVGAWTARITEDVSDRGRTCLLEDFAACSDDVIPESSEEGTADGGTEGHSFLRRKMLKLLVSVRILDEAVDIPQCDSVFYANVPTSQCSDRTLARTVQRLCRAVRVHQETKPEGIANAFLWTSLEDDRVVKLLEMLRDFDPALAGKVRVCSRDYDRLYEPATRAVERVRLEEFKTRYHVGMKQPGGRELVAKKVQWLCALYREKRPSQKVEIQVPADVADSEEPFVFRAGQFLNSIMENWKQGGSPGTRLT